MTPLERSRRPTPGDTPEHSLWSKTTAAPVICSTDSSPLWGHQHVLPLAAFGGNENGRWKAVLSHYRRIRCHVDIRLHSAIDCRRELAQKLKKIGSNLFLGRASRSITASLWFSAC